jgi:hypothetical protein
LDEELEPGDNVTGGTMASSMELEESRVLFNVLRYISREMKVLARSEVMSLEV